MPDKTPQEKYVEAFKALLEAQKEVIKESTNPFNLNMPTHTGLSNETFITDNQLEKLIEKVGKAAADNKDFTKLWNIGTDIILKGKTLFKI